MNRGQMRSKRLRPGRGNRAGALLLFLLLIAIASIGGTLAYLTTDAGPVVNRFEPSKVACTVTEEFDGTTKRSVNVRNTGHTDAYIRVKLVTYRVNAAGQHIGGTAAIPEFSPGTNWVKYNDGFYYYTLPVAPNGTPAHPLIDDITGITLTGSYGDADGGKQAVDVIAEAIQAEPARAVGEAWGVAIGQGSVGPYD